MPQDQSVESGGLAVQAGRDITINNGMSADQMLHIMMKIAEDLQRCFADAHETYERRCAEFQKKVISEFCRTDSIGNRDAFIDPDYQFVFRDAQESFGRSGDEIVKNDLTRLLIERSRVPSTSRLASVLNAAISVTGKLGKEDYATLAGIFLVNSFVSNNTSYAQISMQYEAMLSPFVENFPKNDNSVSFLQSQGCVYITRFGNPHISESLTEKEVE